MKSVSKTNWLFFQCSVIIYISNSKSYYITVTLQICINDDVLLLTVCKYAASEGSFFYIKVNANNIVSALCCLSLFL